MALIAPNPAMDDELVDEHRIMLDHVGDDLIQLQNQAYERGWQVGIEQVCGVNAELLEACKMLLKVYYDTNVLHRSEYEREVAQQAEHAIAKAERQA